MDPATSNLFGQYYTVFDEQIRAILKLKRIRYDLDTDYYNEIFFYVYNKVFTPACLGRFDEARGKFKTWLCKVTYHAVIDWIRSAHEDMPLSRGTAAQAGTRDRERTASLDEMEPHAQDSAIYESLEAEPGIDEADEDEAESRDRIGRALERLSDEHRAAIELLASGVLPVSEHSRRAMAHWTGRPLEEIGRQVDALELRLAGEAGDGDASSTVALYQWMARLAEDRLRRAEAGLRSGGMREEAIEDLMREAEGLSFGTIRQRLRAAGRGAPQRAALEAQELFLRWRKLRGKLDQAAARRERSGAALPTYRELGELLGKPESAIAGLLWRAKKNFYQYLGAREEGEPQKKRMA